MITWGILLSELRAELQDAGTSHRWSDATLYSFTKDALRDYSQYFPQSIHRRELVAVGESYPLPSDFAEVISVECPEDTYLRERLIRPGSTYRDQSSPTYFQIIGGNLHLDAVTAEEVLLTYNAYHGIPTSETDTEFVLTVPEGDIELIKLYVGAKVHSQMRQKTSRLDRFEAGSGRRDDNPLLPETNGLMNEYWTKISLRQNGAVVVLVRPRRRR